MLHLNILPHEEHWRTFLRNLKFVVVDGMHARLLTAGEISKLNRDRIACVQRTLRIPRGLRHEEIEENMFCFRER